MRRWVCPSCGGGAIAPDRPRRDDTRRYCLACSASTGRLVERTCPALDRRRAVSSERTAAKRKASVERRKASVEREREAARARRTLGGVDLLAEAKRLWALPAMREVRGRPAARHRRMFPEVVIRHRRGVSSSGHCRYGDRRIVVTAGTDVNRAIEVVLHELVHAACGAMHGHNATFWRTLRSAACQAWPDHDFRFVDAPSRGWALDSWVASGIGDARRGVAS